MDFPNHFSIVLGLQRDSGANSCNFAALESIVIKSVGYGKYDIFLDYVKKYVFTIVRFVITGLLVVEIFSQKMVWKVYTHNLLLT